MDDPLIYARAIHFGATFAAVGAIFFSIFIAEPAFSKSEANARSPAVLRAQFAWMVWIGLAVAVVSGAVWFILVAQSMSENSFADLFSDGVLWTVLLQTGFRARLARAVHIGMLVGGDPCGAVSAPRQKTCGKCFRVGFGRRPCRNVGFRRTRGWRKRKRRHCPPGS